MSLPVIVVTSTANTPASTVLGQVAARLSAARTVALVPASVPTPPDGETLRFLGTEPQALRLGQGCGCCTVRGDLRSAIQGIGSDGSADSVLVYSQPGDDLSVLAKTFTVADETGFSLDQVATLRSLVAVASVGEFLADPQTVRRAVERIELASVVLLDGSGADPQQRQHASRIVGALNPAAHLCWADGDTRDQDALAGGGPYALQVAQDRASLLDVLYGGGAQDSEGAQRIAFRSRRPFHPGRLKRWLAGGWPGLVRARGRFWVASAPHVAAELDVALGDVQTRMAGHWWAAVPEQNRPAGPDFAAYLRKIWDPVFGDRRQELALVGVGVDPSTLSRSLEGCLLTDGELTNPGLWENDPHPFSWPGGGA